MKKIGTSKTVEEIAQEFLKDLPKIRDYDPKRGEEILEKNGDIFYGGGRWHLECIEPPRNPNEKIGSFYEKIRKLLKNS